jgi:threonine dehydratase
LIAIDYAYAGRWRTTYAKLESMNWTGSIKDRMALHILRRGYETGALRGGALIVEATSGNTGISFAALGRALGHPVVIFMPDWMSPERIALIRSLGAEVRRVSREQGFLGAIARPIDFSGAGNTMDAAMATTDALSVLGGFGTCIVLYPSISNKRKSATFSVSSLTKAGYVYASGSNHDPDGGSNGTTIKVNKP